VAAPAPPPVPTPTPTPTPPAAAAAEATGAPLLGAESLARLPPAERAAWDRYLARSDSLRAADRAAMTAELRAAGKAEMSRAPYAKVFRVEPHMTDDWFRGADAERIADNLLSFQTPSGGWSKRTDMISRPRQAGESYYSETAGWDYIATIDNDATTEQLRFLARAHRPRPLPRWRESFLRGIDYLLSAQYPNGCWPQVYPLTGGYHDAATHNDDAIVNVTRLLGEIGAGRFELVPADVASRAAAAAARGLGCIVATQVVVEGVRTVWAQQHHPLTLEPVAARSYELAGLAGRESASVTAFLMTLPAPDAAAVDAVHAAVAWFRSHRIFGYEYDGQSGLRAVPGAGPLWARLSEVETGRPIFSNRDGVKRYDWNELTDRRRGYSWYGKEPAAVLARYEEWARAHPGGARAR
jgi:PelA/Pel-15E family pectate lyase